MNFGSVYPSKVMLVGEYGVVVGGSALTIPFRRFGARVRSTDDVPSGKEKEARQSAVYLEKLFAYIAALPAEGFKAAPDLDLFRRQLESLWLDMSIPVGYGLGSSGAVSAAIYDLFFPGAGDLSLEAQKEDLALIESYFHGKSSGVDALTCYTGSPLRFRGSEHITQVSFNPGDIPGGYRFFLLDSGERFDTGPLVKEFLTRMSDPEFSAMIRDEYLAVNEKLVETLVGERDADPALLVRVLSDLQFTHFSPMIPAGMVDLWLEGQVSNDYYLKLNGSGGGFILGITHGTSAETLEERWNKQLIWIE